MSAISEQNEFYERYWAEGSRVYSGEIHGYAPNFRRWMSRELGGFPAGAQSSGGRAAETRRLPKT